MQTIALNPSPQLRTMANTVFGYTGNKFEVAARESVIINSHWGGGSREYFALVDLETQRAEQYGECGGLCQPSHRMAEFLISVAMRHNEKRVSLRQSTGRPNPTLSVRDY